MQKEEDHKTTETELLVAAAEEIKSLKEQVAILCAERDHLQRLVNENKDEMVTRMSEIIEAACERRRAPPDTTGSGSASVANTQPPANEDKKRRFDELDEKQMAITHKSISFDQISPGAHVRYVILNNQPYFSVRDSIMVTCRKDPKQAADTWSDFKHKDDLKDCIERHQFPGVGGRTVDVINLCGLLQLVMMLPGQQAKTYRLGFTNILMRYLEGDQSLCSEIQSNSLNGALNSYAHIAGGIMKEMSTSLIYQPAKVCFIYCTFSMAFPGYVKIGRSQDVDKRVASLNTGCAPLPHTIVAMTPTLNPQRDENWAHAHFREYRREGEFFEVSAAAVQEFFDQKINPLFNLEKEEYMTKRMQTA